MTLADPVKFRSRKARLAYRLIASYRVTRVLESSS